MAWLHALCAVGKHFHWVATTSAVLNYQIYNAMYVTVISTLCFIHHPPPEI